MTVVQEKGPASESFFETSLERDDGPEVGSDLSAADAGRWEQIGRWLARGRAGMPPAIVLGGSANGLSFIRSLARRGIRTLLLDSERLIGTYTRFGKTALLPDVRNHAEVWLSVLSCIGRQSPQPAILFATSDEHNVFLAHHAESLRQAFCTLVPPSTTIERIVNKRIQYEVAQSVGIPIPATWFPESYYEVRAVASDVTYPCILKPYKSHLGRQRIAWKKVAVITSAEELVSTFREANTADAEFMVQEIVPGADSSLYGYLAFWDENGAERAWLTKQKLRQSSPFGDGSYQATVEAPEVAELSRRLLKAFDYRGFVGVEFRYDARDRTYRLMEINPRTVSGNQLAISAGVDFPWLGFQHLAGIQSHDRATDGFRVGVEYVNEEWDLKAFLRLRKRGELSLLEWLRSVRRCDAKAIGAWDDMRPFLVMLGRVGRAALRRSGSPGSKQSG